MKLIGDELKEAIASLKLKMDPQHNVIYDQVLKDFEAGDMAAVEKFVREKLTVMKYYQGKYYLYSNCFII